MGPFQKLLLTSLFAIASTAPSEDDARRVVNAGTLLTTVVVYRHGDRSPTAYYPTDPYKDNKKLWPNGAGQLTNQGKSREYQLGKFYRNRYNGFLPAAYSNDDIKIWTTDVDRTIMSALLVLAGLYPPQSTAIWNTNLLWQPLPLRIADPAIINCPLSQCDKYIALMADQLNSPEIQQINEENKDAFEYIKNNTGYDNVSFGKASTLSDTLFVEEHNNLALPAWTKKVYPDLLRNLSAINFGTFGGTEEMQTLSSGGFLFNIIDHFNKVLNGEAKEKMLMYSAHDANLAAILSTLDAFDIQNPPYSSTLMFELRKKNNKNIVNVFYKNETKPIPIKARGCGTDCELDEFENLLRPVLLDPVDWADRCWYGGDVPDISELF